MTAPDVAPPATSARERILNAAYELFSRRGIRAVGTDEVIERAGRACVAHIDHVRDIVRNRAAAAGLVDVEDFASSWHILMKGAIILAAVGDRDAALRAQKMARGLIAAHRPAIVAATGEAVV
jgi:hypothetical protein